MVTVTKILVVLTYVFLNNSLETDSLNILLVFSIPGKSLSLLGNAFTRHLLSDGHEVTLITAFPEKRKPEGVRVINVSEVVDKTITGQEIFNITYLLDHPNNDQHHEMIQIGYDIARITLENEEVKELLKSDKTFDVVIADLWESELYAGIAAYYDCPLIWSFSLGVDSSALKLVHEVANPAYSASYLSSNVPPFSFLERAQELWGLLYSTWIEKFDVGPQEKSFYESYFGPLLASKGRTLPPYEELIHNASLVFSNTHHAMGNLPAIPQSYKLIGGYHIEEPVKPLPADLKTIMDGAKYGVIYFSLGSIWKSETMPKYLVDGLLKVFGKLKQTVFWKFEANLANVPENVHIVKWAPQQSILAHPNCILFISHGGLLSSTEAFHFGVPIIGVPIFIDQILNVVRAAAKGYAIKVDLTHNLPQNLETAIDMMINEPRYRLIAKQLSAIYHDRPASPGAELRHWVRHVVATRGAPHLRSPALLVPWYQKIYLDLAALLLVIVLIFLTAAFFVCKLFWHSTRESKTEGKDCKKDR